MKGISHFVAGVAAASCFPPAVQAAMNGDPRYFILGGLCGLLPDTLDFKLVKFLYRHDLEIAPDPLDPDPAVVAGGMAGAITRAWETGNSVRVKLNTVRLATDRWRQYTVHFDVPERRVEAVLGPVVDTGGRPEDGDPPADTGRKASVKLPCDIRLDYLATTVVDRFDGPVFRMDRTADGTVTPVFLPWHRHWSHGLLLAALLAGLGALVGGWLGAAVCTAAALAHTALDQTGFMGVNLFYPLHSRRIRGKGWTHSGEVLPNLAACWLSGVLVFWNLARQAGTAAVPGLLRYLFLTVGLPAALVLALRALLRYRGREPAEG